LGGRAAHRHLLAVYRYSFLDYAFTFIGFIGLAIPGFMLALIVMYVGFAYFGANVGACSRPTSRRPVELGAGVGPDPASADSGDRAGVSGTAQLIRIMRSNLLDELRKPYVMTAALAAPRAPRDPPISGAGRAESVRQHDRLPAAVRRVGQHHRVVVLSLPRWGRCC